MYYYSPGDLYFIQVRWYLGIHGAMSVSHPRFGLTSTLSRAILHDPVMYPEPDSYKPERFLNSDGSLRDDPVLASSFGFGKRICPGRHFVDGTLFIVVASMLSVFNIEKAKGTPDEFSYLGSGLRYRRRVSLIVLGDSESQLTVFLFFSRPHSFRCSITPRDKKAEELIVTDALTR
jgi:Cytochrome P450